MIDNIIVFLYLIIILAIGIYYKSHSGGFKGFANVKDSSRKNKLLLVATIFASSIGGGTTFGISEKVFSGDISYAYGLLLTIPVDLAIAAYIIPRLIKHYGAESVGDIMHVYYGLPGRFISGIAAMMVSIGFVAAQISVSGYIFQYILETDYITGVVLSYGIVIIYTTIGGLRSVIFTNLLQFFATILAIPIITILGIYKIGLHNFTEQLPIDTITFTSSNNLLSNTITVTLGFAVMELYPNFIQRALINNNPKETSNAIYIKIMIYAVFLVLITLNGLIALNIFPDIQSNLALTCLIDHIIPSGLKGFVVIGLLAAVMSTADSDLNVTTITLVKDFISPIFKIKEQKQLLFIARIANVILGSLSIIIALSFTSVIDLVVYITGFWGPMILVPLVCALFEIIVSTRMMVLCSLGGSASFFLWEHYFNHSLNLKGVFVGTAASLIIFLIGVYSFNLKKL